MGPYRNAANEASDPRTLPRRPSWLAFADVLLGILAAISVVLAILALTLSR